MFDRFEVYVNTYTWKTLFFQLVLKCAIFNVEKSCLKVVTSWKATITIYCTINRASAGWLCFTLRKIAIISEPDVWEWSFLSFTSHERSSSTVSLHDGRYRWLDLDAMPSSSCVPAAAEMFLPSCLNPMSLWACQHCHSTASILYCGCLETEEFCLKRAAGYPLFAKFANGESAPINSLSWVQTRNESNS